MFQRGCPGLLQGEAWDQSELDVGRQEGTLMGSSPGREFKAPAALGAHFDLAWGSAGQDWQCGADLQPWLYLGKQQLVPCYPKSAAPQREGAQDWGMCGSAPCSVHCRNGKGSSWGVSLLWDHCWKSCEFSHLHPRLSKP